ncbi:MAG: hydroxymethylbilane synthase [Candidatus Omnitrophica bacterium]|nr:hydroxymethylbilane synthase [Candidatus Omnitrophota bacterium]
MKSAIRVGTRKSPLAMVQVQEILGALKKIAPGIKTRIMALDTCGDKDKKTPISEMEGTDFFTRELDDALRNRRIDCAVHSAKDLPDVIPDGIVIAAVTAPVDPYDVLVSKGNLKLAELPNKARVGTSSERRKNQLRAYRPDLEIVDIRGTINERLVKLETEGLDAIVIAAAGLVRLGLGPRISERIGMKILKPHPLQGALAVTVRKDDRELKRLFSKLNGKKIASYDSGRKGKPAAKSKGQRPAKRILVTGTSTERFKGMGEIVHHPMIAIKPVTDFRQIDADIRRLEKYDVMMFTSRHAVQFFFQRLLQKRKTARVFEKMSLIAIGKTTARCLAHFGWTATMVPDDESAEGILKMLKEIPLRGKSFLIPRSNLATERLVQGLRRRGARVDAVTVYRNVKTRTRKQDLRQIDEIVFTSPSTVRNFFEKYRNVPERIRMKAIGNVTKACLKEYGKEAEVIPNE